VTLGDAALDRIDEIVPPGITLNPDDNGWISGRTPACCPPLPG
jgi:hypothetical protein